MRFRPCIDIHGGKVKQIVGGSLSEKENTVSENFVSELDAAFYAELYRSKNLKGGHIILLDPKGSENYEKDLCQAKKALAAYPGGLQIGGGVDADNANDFIKAGASHVIVTSYIFENGMISFERINALVSAVGKEHIVLDLSCRRKNDGYYVVTDRWQTFTETEVNKENLLMLAGYCDEFLIHGVDSEGKRAGFEKDIVSLLGNTEDIRSVYAGGISSLADIEAIRFLGRGNVDFTVGSALDLFGGSIRFEDIAVYSE